MKNLVLKSRYYLLLSVFCFLYFSCGSEKQCPGFSDNLAPYIPKESRLVFRNPAGDSLVFSGITFDRTPPHTEKQNVLSVGGSGSKPYCLSSCRLGSGMAGTEPHSLGYSINVDNEALTCSLSVSMASNIPSNDYFLSTVPFSSEGRLFGDTLRLGNYNTTTNPRFSRIEIVYGRGIISIRDDVKKCLWSR